MESRESDDEIDLEQSKAGIQQRYEKGGETFYQKTYKYNKRKHEHSQAIFVQYWKRDEQQQKWSKEKEKRKTNTNPSNS